MAQPTMMIPLEVNGSPSKTTGKAAFGAVSSTLEGDAEGDSFSRTLRDLMESGNDTYALILAMQYVALSPEGGASLPQGGSFTPLKLDSGGNALPLSKAQMSQIETQQAISLADLRAFDPRQPQVILPDGKLPDSKVGQLLAVTAQVADGEKLVDLRGLIDGAGPLQSVASVGQPQLASAGAKPMFALPLQIPVAQPGWDTSLGERLQWMVSKHVQQAEIKLTPPELGPLEIKISLHNDQTNVSFLATHTATRDALEAAIPRLREMFNEVSLNLGHVDVGQHQAGGTAGGDARDSGARQGQFSEVAALSQVSTESTAGYYTHGLLDTYV